MDSRNLDITIDMLDLSQFEDQQEELCAMLEDIAAIDEPRYTVQDLFDLSTKENLQETASSLEIENFEKLSKAELCSILAENFTESDEIVSEFIMRAPEDSYQAFMKLLEIGGSQTIPYDDILKTDIPFAPMPPFVYLFAHNNEFTLLIPNDIIELYKSVDVQYAKDSREEIQLVHHLLETYTGLRGIVKAHDLYDLYRELDPKGMLFEEFLTEAIIAIKNNPYDFTIWSSLESKYPLSEDDEDEDGNLSTLYFIHWMLSNDFAEESEEEFSEEPEFEDVDTLDYVDSLRAEIIERHKEIPAKVIPSKDIWDFNLLSSLLNKPGVSQLLDYLFSNLPDDPEMDEDMQDMFVTSLVENIIKMIQFSTEPDMLVAMLEEEGFSLNRTEKKKIGKILEEASGEIPSWLCNGHTPNDIPNE